MKLNFYKAMQLLKKAAKKKGPGNSESLRFYCGGPFEIALHCYVSEDDPSYLIGSLDFVGEDGVADTCDFDFNGDEKRSMEDAFKEIGFSKNDYADNLISFDELDINDGSIKDLEDIINGQGILFEKVLKLIEKYDLPHVDDFIDMGGDYKDIDLDIDIGKAIDYEYDGLDDSDGTATLTVWYNAKYHGEDVILMVNFDVPYHQETDHYSPATMYRSNGDPGDPEEWEGHYEVNPDDAELSEEYAACMFSSMDAYKKVVKDIQQKRYESPEFKLPVVGDKHYGRTAYDWSDYKYGNETTADAIDRFNNASKRNDFRRYTFYQLLFSNADVPLYGTLNGKEYLIKGAELDNIIAETDIGDDLFSKCDIPLDAYDDIEC